MSKKSGYLIFSSIMVFFFFFCFTGAHLAKEGNIVWSGKYVLTLLLMCLVCGILAGILLTKVLGLIKDDIKPEKRRGSGKVGVLSALLFALGYLPTYLAYYPGICSYDITIQLGQTVSHDYIDHHPLAHTLLVELFLNLGEMLGSVNLGMGLYTLFQMLCVAGVMGLGIGLLYERGVALGYLILVQLLGMFLPVYWYMSVSATKDVLFTVFVLLLMFAMYKLLWENRSSRRVGKWDIILGIAVVGAILFRNNGKYAYLVLIVFGVFTCLFAKKNKLLFRRIWIVGVAGYLAGNLLLSALFVSVDATQGDKREMLSIPIQQFARTYVYHGGIDVVPEDDNTLDEDAKAFLNDFIRDEAYRDYRPEIADPVKKYTQTSVALQRAREWIGLYLKLLVEYPGDYINAVLAVDAGFVYPFDVSHGDINFNGRDRGLGYIQTRWVENELNPMGIYKDSKWEWLHEKLEDFADVNGYQDIPVLKYLMMPGFYLWFYLLFAGYLLWKKKYRRLLPLSFVLGYYVTLLLGPTVQLRYLYPVMVLLPYVLLFCVGEKTVEK